MHTLTKTRQESHQTVKGLLEVLAENFRLKDNETKLSLIYCKLDKQGDDTANEWMGRLRIKATECKYKEMDRKLK